MSLSKGRPGKRAKGKKRKEAGACQSLKCTETTFFLGGGGYFPTVTWPVIWSKCFKQSINFTRKCGFYFKTLPLTAMWKWNVALATRGTAAWESERVIKLTEGVIAQWLHCSVEPVFSSLGGLIRLIMVGWGLFWLLLFLFY